jgi:hypothetical protein
MQGKGGFVRQRCAIRIVMRSVPAVCQLAMCLLAAPTALPAQSLEGTWVSAEPILVCLRFSLTFLESQYRIDCSMGQTLGTWFSTDTQIHFTPTSVGIHHRVGKFDVWNYVFVDTDTFLLSTGPLSVRLTRKRQRRTDLPPPESGSKERLLSAEARGRGGCCCGRQGVV